MKGTSKIFPPGENFPPNQRNMQMRTEHFLFPQTTALECGAGAALYIWSNVHPWSLVQRLGDKVNAQVARLCWNIFSRRVGFCLITPKFMSDIFICFPRAFPYKCHNSIKEQSLCHTFEFVLPKFLHQDKTQLMINQLTYVSFLPHPCSLF